ncbi:MAG: SAM-dependent methyltransferase [Deltaproteobacteria bacterium]|nr:SAM-dependent methyltransferase [Deltaproteobacteria bacterium]
MPIDWQAWHDEYDTPGSRLARRLSAVQGFIRDAIDRAPPGPIRAVSVCAGEGRDLLGVLAGHPRAPDVAARLVELDPELAARARAGAPPGVEVVCGDASITDSYRGAAPADLVLVCGVFGNVTDDDVRNTVVTLPTLCAPGATVIWTRHRRPPDLTVDIRRWFSEAGFEEAGFVASDEVFFGVGANRLCVSPPAWTSQRLFTFVGADTLAGSG